MRHQSRRKQPASRIPYGQRKSDPEKVRIKRSAEPYVYKSLEPGSWIRILELQPGEDDDPINCDLSIVNQNQNPEYEALSYTWGRPTDTRLIGCSGKKLKIPVHLRDALLKLRRTSEVRYLWADAACIDQSNIQERGHQVSIMGSIYAGAERVIVWLGDIQAGYFDDQEESLPALALRFLCLDCEKPGFPENDFAGNLQSADLEADLVEFLTGISELSRLPYFSRLWVLQEVGLGKSVVALLGNREFDIIVVLRILAYLRKSVTLLAYFRIRVHPQLAFSLFPILSNIIFGEDNVGIELDFLSMLIWTQSQMASDPRDYVYALLGHPSALIQGHLIVEPDYTKAPAALFHEVAVKLIEYGQDLRVLCAVYHRSEADLEEDYPSWVPTWTREGHPGRIGNDVRFDASAGLPGSWHFGSSNMTIHIQGFIIDVVDEYSRSFSSSDLLDSRKVRPVDILDTWPVEDALDFKSRITISLDEKLSEIGRLITDLSTFSTGKVGQSREMTALYLYMKERTTSGLKKDKMALQRMMESRGETRLVHEVISNCAHSLEDRKLFSTQNGLFGLGPSVARKGDICCILFGATVPIILRKVGSTYRFVGEAYIGGVMHGEACVDFLLAEKYKEQIFNIF
jgi:hypothetical protein